MELKKYDEDNNEDNEIMMLGNSTHFFSNEVLFLCVCLMIDIMKKIYFELIQNDHFIIKWVLLRDKFVCERKIKFGE